MTRRLPWIAAAFCVVLTGLTGAARADGSLTVVELYTSQGCSSCPPADAILNSLAGRDDLLALGFHVDYWNYLGWKDPFSSSEATERQRGYSRTLRRQYVYTPQIVVDGAAETVGSRESAVDQLIDSAGSRRKIDIEVSAVERTIARIHIPADDVSGVPASVWLVFYDHRHTTEILRGENRGRTLSYANVVRRIEKIGTWRGRDLTLTVALDAHGGKSDACAVIVQSGETGPVLGATRIPMPPEG